MMRLRKNKRGVSPLIATILLIAFAVALGAVVMSIGRNMPVSCDVSIGIEEIGGNQMICIEQAEDQASIIFTLYNGGEIAIEDLHVRITGSKEVFNTDSVLSSPLSKADGKKLTITYDTTKYGTVQKLVIIPKVRCTEHLELWDEAKLEFEYVRPC